MSLLLTAQYRTRRTDNVCGKALHSGEMLVLTPREKVTLQAIAAARLMIVGGTALGHRYMFWNFVSDDKTRVEQAKRDWRDGRFTPVPGDEEFIPLPE